MIKNYLKIAFRNLWKYKGYSLINVLGLAIGMACCILIMLYVNDELSYDTYHEKADRIYRVSREWFNSDGETSLHLGHVAPPIAPLILNDFPDVQHAVRITGAGNPLISYKGKYFEEPQFFFADPDVFEVFTMPFISGDPATALENPSSIVVSESMAQKYFGDTEAIGQTLTFERPGRMGVDLKVTGVMKDTPRNSHFHFDFLGSMKALEMAFGDDEFQSWGSNNYSTFLLLPEGYPYRELEAKFPDFLDRHLTSLSMDRTGNPPSVQPSVRNKLHLWKLADIHLYSNLDSEIESNGNITYVYIFSSVALFILLIACINFMNLATARSASRMKEVGLRKVVGADRKRLILQFLGESIFLSFVALAVAILFVELAFPTFSDFVGRELSIDYFGNIGALLGLVGIALAVGIISGSYPAFYLSGFQPAKVLKGSTFSGFSRSRFRTTLVVLQFAISIVLIISMGVVQRQLAFCTSKNLGLDKEHVLVLPASEQMLRRYVDFKNRLLQHPRIVSVAGSKRVPSGRLLDSSGARVVRGDQTEPLNFRIANVRVDHDFIDAYGIEMVAGRNFSVDFPTDSSEAFILNEVAVEKIGWPSADDAVGKPFLYDSREGKIIGVVGDFHYESLHQPITPIVMIIAPQRFNQISIRVQPGKSGNFNEVLSFLQGIWQEFRPNYPFEYSFLDERYEELYLSEHKLGEIFLTFSGLAVFVACLGLFGLASFTAEQRTKEIGVRKVLGATVPGVVLLLSREFARLVLFATILAWPLSYFSMRWWLEDFAYRININTQADTFVLSALLALIIALLTVSYQAVKTALTNPVEALHYE